MEMEVETDDVTEDFLYESTDDADASDYENGKCGICMDVVIDRGVLDCCQHWFCFACIDNWATITSLCPLCQNEFQLITCVPVYDTIGSSKDEDDLISREDEWCIEGNNNTLSFPSYYIDENSVICLDGDDCMIRSGLAATEENSNLDTSIACDSCDTWYHAFCVGFDPEGTSESSWLCPRCVIVDVPHNLDGLSMERPTNQCNKEPTSNECLVEPAFTRKVSVSVADAGETAVVVSIVSNSLTLETEPDDWINAQPYPDTEETSLALSVSPNLSALSPSNSVPPKMLDVDYAGVTTNEPNRSEGCKISLPDEKLSRDPSECESNTGPQPGLLLRPSLSGNKDNGTTEVQVTGDVVQQKPPVESSLPDDRVPPKADENAVRYSGSKRKATTPRDHAKVNQCSENENRKAKSKMENQGATKKARSDGKSQMNPLKHTVRKTITEGAQKPCSPRATDIMSIVGRTYQRPSDGVSHSKAINKSSKDGDNGAGLRVKKIMRRGVEGESSALDGLRKEIREAIRNKDPKDFSKDNLLDPKLLMAFRAAIGGPKTEPETVRKLSPSIIRMKKSMLQKGKTRESLTKKIYGTANGKRRRAWDRDWEIEFWKHRCTGATNPEKLDTLKSVLNLLRKNPEDSGVKEEPEGEAAKSILSRLYLADTSVFPRRDDIQPLSALTGSSSEKVDYGNSKEVASKLPNSSHPVQNPSQASKNLSDTIKDGNSSGLKVEAACKIAQLSGTSTKKSLPSLSSGSKVNVQATKDMPSQSDVKIDKRKWALEVLARKAAIVERDATQGRQEDNALKGNYPLLAQLPMDMKPVLAPSRHNKIPVSVRQAQLYRLTEHLLKKANLPVMRRTAETELAVADAVNIEKDVVDRSNSKPVYINLCSQVLRQHVIETKRSSGVEESDPSSSAACADKTDPTAEHADASAEEALKLAGLVSDSPPGSPYRPDNDMKDDDDLLERAKCEEGPENVFDMDSRPELDIYGDFEYDLEDEVLIGASALKSSKSLPEEVDLKMKVVFSTLNLEKTTNALDSKDQEGSEAVETALATSCSIECVKDGDPGSSTFELKTVASCHPSESLQGEENGELSLAECEELYGPDKEPLIQKFPDQHLKEPDKLVGTGNIVSRKHVNSSKSSKEAAKQEFQSESCAENIYVEDKSPADHNSSGGENSPTHSLMSENVRGKEKKSHNDKPSDTRTSISRKVEAYIKEHIRPLCKSGVITAEQYRWAVAKTTDKIMRYHSKDKNANFLIKEGEKVKKLAEQYVEAAQQKKET